MKNAIKFFYAFGIVALTAYIASYFTQFGIYNWYSSLEKPAITPPDSWFPIIWTILYILMAAAFALILIKVDISRQRKANLLFLGQLFLQVLWVFLFFYQGYIALAFAVIILLDIVVYKMIKIFSEIDTLASQLLYPYFWWLVYASFLNLSFIYIFGMIIVF